MKRWEQGPYDEKFPWTEERFAGNYRKLVPCYLPKSRELIVDFKGTNP